MVRDSHLIASILGILCLAACGGGNIQERVVGHVAAELPSTDVCIAMAGGNGKASGLQMDLSWDSACMTAARAGGNAAQCTSNPSTGKGVETNLLPDAQMRVLFLSVSDTSPVPDGELFCCTFTVVPSQAGSCCSVNIGNLILADAHGRRVYPPGITVQASVDGAVCELLVPTPLNPTAPVPLPPVTPTGS
jgi:hypothetical protein